MRERKATKIFKRKGTKLNTDNYQDFTNMCALRAHINLHFWKKKFRELKK